MLNALSSASCAAWVLDAPAGSAVNPRIRKMIRLIPRAGADVHHMLRMCWLTVTPPTRLGTRIVVSDRGVILSPK